MKIEELEKEVNKAVPVIDRWSKFMEQNKETIRTMEDISKFALLDVMMEDLLNPEEKEQYITYKVLEYIEKHAKEI